VVILIQFALFLVIGLCLYVWYADHHWNPPDSLDKIYPLFIWEHLPAGLAGLVIAAILAAAMSNLSAAMNALASTTVMDFWKPLAGAAHTDGDARWLTLARYTTVVWGAVLFGVALMARNWGSVLQAGLSIASIIYGSLLGVFLLGLLTRRVGPKPAALAMFGGLAVMLYVKFGTPIAFTWYVLIGTAFTFAIGLIGSLIWKENSPRGES
jgi:Na+/proline symporter